MSLKTKFRNKTIVLLSLIASFSTITAAQLGGNSRIPGTDLTINGAINAVLFWDLGTGAGFWLGLTTFIVVWLGIHFATRPFLQQIFEAMLDHFPSSNSRTNINRNDEGEIKGINALSLLVAFTTAQLIGQFFGLIPLVLLGILPVSMAAWGTIKGSSSFRNDFGDYINNRSGNSDEGASAEQIQSLQNEIGSLQDEIEDLKEKEDETEDEESSGQDPSTLGDEVEVEIEELEDLTSKLEGLESDFEAVLSNVKEEEKYVLREEQDEEKSIQQMQEAVQEAQTTIEAVARVKGNMEDPGRHGYENYSALAEEFQNVAQNIQDFEGVLAEELEVIEEIGALKSELQNLEGELEEAEKEFDEVESLDQELKDEEIKAEKIAKKYDDRANWEKIKEEEEETANAIKEMENVLQEKNRIESKLQEEIEELEQIEQKNRQEVQQIQQILQELNKEENELETIEQAIERESSQGLHEATRKYIAPELDNLRETINKLEDEGIQVMEQFKNS